MSVVSRIRSARANQDIVGLLTLRGSQQPGKYEGPFAPVILSIVGIIGWLVFILVYALFWSGGFSLFQNIVVTIVSLAITGLLIGLMWLVWFHPTGEPRRKREEVSAQ